MSKPSITAWWIRLTSPHRSITDIERRRQSRLLSALILAIMVPLFVSTIHGVTSGAASLNTALNIMLLIVVAITLWINRRGHYSTAAYFFFGAITINFILSPVLSGMTQFLFNWITFLLLSTILLPRRSSYVLAAVALLQMVFMLLHYPEARLTSTLYALMVFVIAGAVLAVFVQNRDALEWERQAELRATRERLALTLAAARMGTTATSFYRSGSLGPPIVEGAVRLVSA